MNVIYTKTAQAAGKYSDVKILLNNPLYTRAYMEAENDYINGVSHMSPCGRADVTEADTKTEEEFAAYVPEHPAFFGKADLKVFAGPRTSAPPLSAAIQVVSRIPNMKAKPTRVAGKF